jgi:hypothetical protein
MCHWVSCSLSRASESRAGKSGWPAESTSFWPRVRDSQRSEGPEGLAGVLCSIASFILSLLRATWRFSSWLLRSDPSAEMPVGA